MLVLDCSVILHWGHDSASKADQTYAQEVLRALRHENAIVPTLLPIELANGLRMLEKQKHINFSEVLGFFENLRKLPIKIDETIRLTSENIYAIAKEYELTCYDAAYLELAMRHQIPLATNDKQLKKAAQKTVGLFTTH